jgi:hypothetical protein
MEAKMGDIDKVFNLHGCWARLPDDLKTATSLRQLEDYSRPTRSNTNGFPEPVRTLSRFKLYNLDEIIEWLTLWKRATENLGYPKGLKNQKGTK